MKPTLKLPIVGAILTAILSTLCCLPAFLFLFFGISSTALSVLTQLEFLRIPLGIVAILFFAITWYKMKQSVSCACSIKQKKQYRIGLITIFVTLFMLLFYPEIIPLFMES
jgi:mercuric ion transport protein